MAEIEAIADPCSVAAGHPTGLAGMGIVERVDVVGGSVAVLLLPTFPTCMFRGVFETEIEQRLRALPWCERVERRVLPVGSDLGRVADDRRSRATFGRRERGASVGKPRVDVVDR